MRTSATLNQASEGAIFARLWETENGTLSPSVARYILGIAFSESDDARMHALTVKNQEGHLTRQEKEELDNYVKVADLLAILQSKARKVIQKKRRNGTIGNG